MLPTREWLEEWKAISSYIICLAIRPLSQIPIDNLTFVGIRHHGLNQRAPLAITIIFRLSFPRLAVLDHHATHPIGEHLG